MKLRASLLFAVLFLSACDHHAGPRLSQASAAEGQNDADLTGESPKTNHAKPYPRATLVSLPPESEAPAATPPADNGATPATQVSDSTSMASSSPSTDNSNLPSTPANPPADSSSAPATDSSATPASSPATDTSAPVTVATPPPAPPAPTIASTLPIPTDDAVVQKQVVVLQTSMGSIVIELDEDAAPKTCANFLKLVSEGFYNHTAFHRIIPDFMIQGGDPNSRSNDRASYGQGSPGYTLPAEIGLKHDRGSVAMARLPDSVNPKRESNGSQFYICVAPCPSLDDNYTVFGHVIKGMDVADKIAAQPRDPRDNPLTRIDVDARVETQSKALRENSANNP